MNQVLQSGVVTPGHLASWTTDGVVQDAGVTFVDTLSTYRSDALAVNFNKANTDTAIPINLPAGYTRWRCAAVRISGASGTLTTATCGLFTGPAATGATIVTGGSSITVNNGTADTNNNFQQLTVNNQNTLVYSDTVIYFRVANAQGVAATANVTVQYEPLP